MCLDIRKADGAIVVRYAERNHHNTVMSMLRKHTQRERKSTYGRFVWLSYGRVSYADYGLVEKCCMLAVVDHIPWATLSILIGRDIHVMFKLHGDVHMNAPSRAHIYIPWQCSYSGGIMMVSLSKVFCCYMPHTCTAYSFPYFQCNLCIFDNAAQEV